MTKKVPSKAVNYPEVEDFEQIVSNLRSMRAEFTEDIPPFETRYAGVLEGILAQIRAEYYGKELYKGVVNKAVWLFYCLIKNHPFFNGNKRVAVVALFDFLKRNVSELYIDEDAILNDLFQMAIRTSESDPAELEQVKRYLKRKIRKFILEF
ncbi:MAG: type II toxin-antitoxin system death-on-curing family toxin [Lewinellaceae bacterium]|nr:type II toxin-antitoxin system death-on-curing family toxin [Saprospiraceae bacterium]MCB9353464.1 type II toxin-antitoxin system death-on-curing family toxin [Lewinellaceae bacterium]